MIFQIKKKSLLSKLHTCSKSLQKNNTEHVWGACYVLGTRFFTYSVSLYCLIVTLWRRYYKPWDPAVILHKSQAGTQAWPIAWKNTFSCSQWWRHSQPRAWYKHSCPFLLGCLFVRTRSVLQGCLEISSPLHKCTWVLSAKKKKGMRVSQLVPRVLHYYARFISSIGKF